MQANKEKEIFANYCSNYKKRILDNPLNLGIKAADFDLNLNGYLSNVKQYENRIANQSKQKEEAEHAERARMRAEKEAEEFRKREAEEARLVAAREARIAVAQKEAKQKNTFNICAWLFCLIVVAAKTVIIFIEPITEFMYVALAGMDILFGLVIGWIGKITERERKRSLSQTWIMTGMTAVVVLIAQARMDDPMYMWITVLAGCVLATVGALITRGKTRRG